MSEYRFKLKFYSFVSIRSFIIVSCILKRLYLNIETYKDFKGSFGCDVWC